MALLERNSYQHDYESRDFITGKFLSPLSTFGLNLWRLQGGWSSDILILRHN